MTLEVLSGDKTIYVSSSGSDTNDGDTSSTAYATIGKAIERVKGIWPGDYLITVDIGTGVYTESATLDFNYPFGKQVTFKGASEYIGECTMTAADTSVTRPSGTQIAKDYFYFTVQFPEGKSVTTGIRNYLLITASSGGTNPEAIRGAFPVTSWNSTTREATVRARLSYNILYGFNLPSGSITCTATILTSVFDTSHSPALDVCGPYHGGTWNSLVFEGPNVSGTLAISVTDTACFAAGSEFAVMLFATAYLVDTNSTLFADESTIQSCSIGLDIDGASVANLRSATVSLTTGAIKGYGASTIAASSLLSNYSMNLHVVNVTERTVADVDNATMVSCLGATPLGAWKGALISAVGTTIVVTGYDESSPAYNTLGDSQAYVYQP